MNAVYIVLVIGFAQFSMCEKFHWSNWYNNGRITPTCGVSLSKQQLHSFAYANTYNGGT